MKASEPTKPPSRKMRTATAVIAQEPSETPGPARDLEAYWASHHCGQHPVKAEWDPRSITELYDAGVDVKVMLHPEHPDHARWLQHAAIIAKLEVSPKWSEPDSWFTDFGWSKLGLYVYAVDAYNRLAA